MLSVHLNRDVTAIRLWTADSPDRDFRNDHWTSRALSIYPSGAPGKRRSRCARKRLSRVPRRGDADGDDRARV